jgi:2-polyprenyl-3-methyl-5-hydroxy-6-metoxy-1,4-benzoquinol methylase
MEAYVGAALVEKGYLLDNAWQQARRRLAYLEEYSDPGTQRRVEALGIRPGWRCLEVGAGGGTMSRWLCRRTAPEGSVLALDLDPRFMVDVSEPNLEVRKQDVVAHPPPEGAFDFVLARFVLMHIPQREQVLERLAASLKPGGWLLVEDMDAFSTAEIPHPVCRRVLEAQFVLGRAAGMDISTWARRLPERFQRLGLAQVGTEAQVPFVPGGSAPAGFFRLTADQLRARLLETGLATREELELNNELLLDPHSWFFGLTTIAVWGQRPPR